MGDGQMIVNQTTSLMADSEAARPAGIVLPKIAIRDLERSYGLGADRIQATGPLDLTVNEGEFVSVVGPSGCGKSTLLRLVAGLLKPTKGTVNLYLRSAAGAPTATVFQDYSIFPWKTVRQNVQIGLKVIGAKKQDVRRVADQWLDRLGLTAFADAYPGSLSGGMKQRVAIARALCVEPEILLMDEPFAALDAQLRLLLQDELLRLWEANRWTVLFITHSLDEAILLSDRVLVMSARPGRILAEHVVPFPRPRREALRGEPEFGALQQQLWAELRGEIDQSVGGSRGDG
jgi:NitT/TauT family transport system ATP-binding protein